MNLAIQPFSYEKTLQNFELRGHSNLSCTRLHQFQRTGIYFNKQSEVGSEVLVRLGTFSIITWQV